MFLTTAQNASSISCSNSDFNHSLDVETSQEHEEIKWQSNLVSGQFEFLENSRASLPFAKISVFIEQIGRNRPMKGRIAINGRDEASFDRNGAIKSHPFDL